jgi:hypothetical protein
VFSVANTVLFRALPFASPERLVWIASVRTDNPSAPFSQDDHGRGIRAIVAFHQQASCCWGDAQHLERVGRHPVRPGAAR